MEGDSGKLFIGGISWETNEERLTEYFGQFGEVAEAVIMRDRVTGRARGFGFIVFVDSAVAERVILEKHMIDGRMVEAKKAVPRDDQSIIGSKTANSVISSPGGVPSSALVRTRKIFVGGLPSSITEPDFKLYFEQFGSISDVVVMYDQTTQRPRGFGFITFDLEESVDRVLAKSTFHQLNGKMVEVKRAVPKEVSPGPNMRSPTPLGRVNNFLNGYGAGYGSGSPGPIGSYGMRVDGRYGLLNSVGGRNGLSGFGPGYGMGMGMGMDSGIGVGMGLNSGLGFNASPGYGRQVSPGPYGSSRYGSIGGMNMNEESNRSVFARTLWGNGGISTGLSNPNPNSFIGNRNMGPFENNGMLMNSNLVSGNNVGLSSGGNNGNWIGPVGSGINNNNVGNNGINNGNNGFGFVGGAGGYGMEGGTGGTEFANRYGVKNEGFYGGNNGNNNNEELIYGGDKTWSFGATEFDGPGPSGYNMDGYAVGVAHNETSRGISS
ncbi:hypothetical protein LUZ60_006367 [Juncus effusus]|nr:hypothetical protein LUZ60_006367 [Juncus effusus]